MELPESPLVSLGRDEYGNALWVKRDDLLPCSFGGNKARIALELLEDMRAQGKNHMIAYGNARSNLCRALSNLCAAASVPCTVLSPADEDGSRQPSYNLLMCQSFGAEIIPCHKQNVAAAVDEALERSLRRGLKPYYLYGDRTGGGNLVAPPRAYRKVWQELARQQAALGLAFDELFLASGTGMTQAGLLIGQALDGGGPRINGISIARSEAAGVAHLQAYLEAANCPVPGEAIHFTDAYALGYGAYSEDILRCARDAMRRWGMPLDLTYTGKAFYGMGQEIQRRGLRGRQILFLHTGGTPLFFDKAEEIFGAVAVRNEER